MDMVFVHLYDGKVMQLSPDKWDGYVMANYPEYSNHFLVQAEVLSVVKEGLIFHGPFAG